MANIHELGAEFPLQTVEEDTDTSDASARSSVSSQSKAMFIRSMSKSIGIKSRRQREKEEILLDATRLGESRPANWKSPIIMIIYNPISGGGTAKKMVHDLVVPVLAAARTAYTITETQYKRHAVEVVQQLDTSSVDGILIAGGDGLVHEVITGYFMNPDQDGIRRIPVGIAPSGTANAMANTIHRHPSKTPVSLVGRAALAVAKGLTCKVDVIRVERETVDDEKLVYALSCFGWGIAGAVALKADKLRWIPGQKKARYDIAGAVSMLTDWPIVDKFKFEYPVKKDDGTHEWKTEYLSTINMISANMPYLGDDHAISPRVTPDDGNLAVVVVNGTASRMDVIRLAFAMKKGVFLGEDPTRCRTFVVPEFKITPTEARSPYNIDGDPHDNGPVHVKVLHQALKMFCLPLQATDPETVSAVVLSAPTAVAASFAGVNPAKLGLAPTSFDDGSIDTKEKKKHRNLKAMLKREAAQQQED
eukprot:TRINITY_DN12393_c0_g1_i4.p1 TRINITY_DN12393_c0_g1~~TRINITY_DN12393_c0_g1_i4.p1  ORF type:complete len:476 (+),score=119.90 TRINITY_DN12393_c0_g1_i4:888-2315(+)